jgi:FtsP/CotA-like multicopper oxidase with cupredoxin domain
MEDTDSVPVAVGGNRSRLRSLLTLFAAVIAVAAVLASTVLIQGGQVSLAARAASQAQPSAPQTRTYFIGADEVRWNYAPDGKDDITGKPFDDVSSKYSVQGPGRIGSTYIKALYREYTDPSFRALKPRGPEWEHLGYLGPVIHAVVGDKVRIVFRNNLDRPVSIHMHGLKYDKASEGAPYNDGTSPAQQADDAVAPGKVYTYDYSVPDRAGPGPMDPSSVMWMYHSHTDEIADTYGGLVGPVVVTKAGMARRDGSPADVDREMVQMFQVSNENNSPYLDKNISTFAPDAVPGNEDFDESNLMHSINGYVFGNQPLGQRPGQGMTLRAGQRVRWYLMGMGTEVDLHTPHWHGNTVVANGMRTDVTTLLPAQMVTADMTPDNPGTWLLHCHVNDHIAAGMLTRYQVVP